MRGRPTNNRRGPNPLTRSYESNGPDVKIRGNAQHVAEKYLQLARDAHTGGDPVAAENYLQHAEHYFRLIAAAQAAQAMAQSGQRPPGDIEASEFDDDDDFSAMSDRFASPSERVTPYPQQNNAFSGSPNAAPNAPQPYLERPQFEPENRPGQSDRVGFVPRQDRQGGRFPDRGPRGDRQFGDRNEYRDNRQNRDGRPRDFRPYREGSQPPRETGVENSTPALPSFITGEPRSSTPEDESVPAASASEQSAVPASQNASDAGSASGENVQGEIPFQGRGRRRRLRSPYGFNARQTPEEEAAAPNANTIGDETPATE
jgi:Domain of unknown function (DUF4167)